MRNCSLDLRLSPVDAPAPSCRQESMATNPSSAKEIIVVCTNGRLWAHNMEEFQIRAIIEMGRRRREVTALGVPLVGFGSPLGFRVKRSLQRFLQKRKMRSQSLSPNCSSSSSPNC